jgi:hypothetical protein
MGTSTLIECIPDPQVVREKLSQLLREARLVRQQLKLAERAARERKQRKAVSDAA